MTWIKLIELLLGMFVGFSLFTKFFWRTLFIIIRWIFVTLFHLLQWGFGRLQHKFFPETIKPASPMTSATFDKTQLKQSKEAPLKYAELSDEEIREVIKNHPELVTIQPKAGGD